MQHLIEKVSILTIRGNIATQLYTSFSRGNHPFPKWKAQRDPPRRSNLPRRIATGVAGIQVKTTTKKILKLHMSLSDRIVPVCANLTWKKLPVSPEEALVEAIVCFRCLRFLFTIPIPQPMHTCNWPLPTAAGPADSSKPGEKSGQNLERIRLVTGGSTNNLLPPHLATVDFVGGRSPIGANASMMCLVPLFIAVVRRHEPQQSHETKRSQQMWPMSGGCVDSFHQRWRHQRASGRPKWSISPSCSARTVNDVLSPCMIG